MEQTEEHEANHKVNAQYVIQIIEMLLSVCSAMAQPEDEKRGRVDNDEV